MPLNQDWDIFGTGERSRFTSSNGLSEMNLSTIVTQEIGQPAVAGIPILGTGTVRMRTATALTAIPKFPGGLATERGLIAGKIRTIMRWTDLGGVAYWGLIALQSALDMTVGTNNAYALACSTLNLQNRIHIAQINNTTLSGWGSLASSPLNAFVNNTPLAVEFEWDASGGTSVSLAVRTGSALDFSNLSLLISFVDTVSPHVTSLGEGFWGVASTGVVDVYWDNTTVFKRS